MSKINDDFPGAEQLIGAGYTTEAKIDAATDEELLTVDGIGPATLEKIREARAAGGAEAAEATDEAGEQKAAGAVAEYPCPNPACGHLITSSPCPYCNQ